MKDKKAPENYLLGRGTKVRINRKKALFDMTWIIKQNSHRFNNKELMLFIKNCEEKLIMPEDFDIMQNASIRDKFVFINNGKLYFHILENGKETKKAIKLLDDSIIILGKNYVCRINNKTKEIEDDIINILGVMPLDSIYYTKDNLVFVLKK